MQGERDCWEEECCCGEEGGGTRDLRGVEREV